jgi:hypothetical protein
MATFSSIGILREKRERKKNKGKERRNGNVRGKMNDSGWKTCAYRLMTEAE